MTKAQTTRKARLYQIKALPVLSAFSLSVSFIMTYAVIGSTISPASVAFSFIISYMILLTLGWNMFFHPYQKLRKSRHKLHEAKERAELIARFPINNPHPQFQINAKGEITYANPATLRHFPDIKEKAALHPLVSGTESLFDTIKAGDRHEPITREINYKDSIYLQTISPVQDSNGLTLMFYCYEITTIKHTQQKARLLEAAIINANDAVLITDTNIDNPEGPTILYVNEAFTQISGYTAEEAIGKTPKILQGHDTDRKILRRLRETLQAGQPFKGELKNYSKKKVPYWLEISIVPVKDEYGKVTHFASIQRDITQRKAFEKEMQINREAAEVANRAKDDFLANMSHELRTPMNGIIGLSELLMEMNLSSEQYELAEAVNSSSRNLLILLNDILDLSKIEANELTLENIPFDLRRTVRQTIELLGPMASRKGVIVENTINPIVPDRVMGDPARLQQIMNNLVSNAIKFTEIGYVRLDIASSRDNAGDPVLHIRVEDTGIGIPEDKREMIFNKFTQVDVSTARKYGGTGLGLAITKELVELMGGIISFDSVEGRGTTFYVEIPIEIAKNDNAANEKGRAHALANGGIDIKAQVMVVDDHPVNLLFMLKVLRKLGFTNVGEARSGKEAIELFKQRPFDLIFMDCQMPELDGFEASAIIREMENFTGKTKIIAVTADAMKGARERCINNGMNDYISKPIDIEKLKGVLCEWLPGDNTQTGQEKGEPTQQILAMPSPGEMVMDWERLSLFTDGDAEEELQLIGIFTEYATETLEALRNNCTDSANDEWKKAAHKLKGSAANLGAQKLSSACMNAEQAQSASKAEKLAILEEVLSCYAEVEKELTSNRRQLATV